MVVVVPPLPVGEQRKPPVVARVVPRVETHRAPRRVHVHDGVDAVGRLPAGRRAHHERPEPPLEAQQAQRGGVAEEEEVVAVVHPLELGELEEVGHRLLPHVVVVVRAHEPPHVGPREALPRRVRVLRPVRVVVVVAVLAGPPHGPPLPRHAAESAEHGLRWPRGLEGAVAEVAVIPRRDHKHPEEVGEGEELGCVSVKRYEEASHDGEDVEEDDEEGGLVYLEARDHLHGRHALAALHARLFLRHGGRAASACLS
mmetsp:Transcript_41360/g.132109  ORF Transcript_41360/g.132109 Transcript_41360/m.132109 type:complete len:256 (+) Transcript_41360:278-1045(+)